MKKIHLLTAVLFGLMPLTFCDQTETKEVVSQEVMEKIYNEVKSS